MRLLNADYHTWVQNPGFVTDLKQQVVAGINQYCKCGFNAGYLKGEDTLLPISQGWVWVGGGGIQMRLLNAYYHISLPCLPLSVYYHFV